MRRQGTAPRSGRNLSPSRGAPRNPRKVGYATIANPITMLDSNSSGKIHSTAMRAGLNERRNDGTGTTQHGVDNDT